MVDPNRQARAVFLAPVVQAACASLVDAMDDIGEDASRRALASMVDDPTERIMWEIVDGSRAWDIYQAGGPLQAQHVELTIGPEVSPSPAEVRGMLRTLANPEQARVEATEDPWRVTLHVSGLLPASASVLPVAQPGQDEDLFVQVCIGTDRITASSAVPASLIRAIWQDATHAALDRWHAENSRRPLVDHPGFAQVVERPSMGLPGIYLIRLPRFPFSPLVRMQIYERPVGWAVFETAAEFSECERYYQTPGASFFREAPRFRNRPPSSERPARLAGGIAEAGHRLVATPWSDIGAVSVITLPFMLLDKLSAERRARLHRGRYDIYTARTPEEANQAVREVFGPGLDAKPVRAAHSMHPKARPKIVVRSPKLIVVAEPGIEHEAQALFLTHQSLKKTPVPDGAPAVVVIGENLDLTRALLPHVVVAAASKAGDGGAAMAEAMSSEARVLILDAEALGFAVMALPHRVERRQNRVTLAAMVAAGDNGSVVELARKLDALVILVGPAPTDGAGPARDAAHLAGLLKRAGIPFRQVASVPAPPVPLGLIADELWNSSGGEHHG